MRSNSNITESWLVCYYFSLWAFLWSKLFIVVKYFWCLKRNTVFWMMPVFYYWYHTFVYWLVNYKEFFEFEDLTVLTFCYIYFIYWYCIYTQKAAFLENRMYLSHTVGFMTIMREWGKKGIFSCRWYNSMKIVFTTIYTPTKTTFT